MSEQIECKVRLTVTKEGRSVYISHLDFMRVLIRALIRANLPLKHSEGFHQRTYLSLVRPLSLGYESGCELCDIVLTKRYDVRTLPALLNPVLPEGVRVVSAVENAVNGRDIIWTSYDIVLEKPEGTDEALLEKLRTLWLDPEFSVMKRNKKGKLNAVCVAGYIRSIDLAEKDDDLLLQAVLKDSPDGGLNPSYLLNAAQESLGVTLELVSCRRTGFYNEKGESCL